MTEKKQTIEEIKEIFLKAKGNKKALLLNKYKNDKRMGVQKEIRNAQKSQKQLISLKKDYIAISNFERGLYKKGFNLIAGVDEAGRGSFAGPLVAAAVILPKNCYIAGLKECKQLLPHQREELYPEIVSNAVDYSVVEVSWTQIDEIGLHQANIMALHKAIVSLKHKPDFLLSDGFNVETSIPNLKIIKGDTVSVSIAAASVIAKVYRDRLMNDYHITFPDYGFDRNKGYGTKEHKEALKKLGPTRIHRKSFDPVRLCLAEKQKL
jgi:ribonuclease HII